MLLTLEALKAAEGDCLLLHWGTAADPKLLVTDGGPGRIYDDFLRPRLLEIRSKRGLPHLTIDLVIVSHLDSDHIFGVKKLFRQLRKEVEDQRPVSQRPLKVSRLWHNIFNDIVGDATDAYYQKLPSSLLAANNGAASAELEDKVTTAIQKRYGTAKEEAAREAAEIAAILAAHGDGRDLRKDYEYLRQQQNIGALNAPFQDAQGRPRLIQADAAQASPTIGGLKLEILGPRKAEIETLQKEFDDWLRTSRNVEEATLLAAYADRSVKNLSSIVCLASFEGKTILFTGDARGDKILKALEAAGHLAQGSLKVDVLKVPHHGSDHNVTEDFFKKVIADHYVFSGDGEYGNPERTTLEWLTNARGKQAKYTIHLTYPVSSIDPERKKDMEKHGRIWKEADHSLKAFFEKRRAEGYAYTLNDSGRIVIELGDEAIGW